MKFLRSIHLKSWTVPLALLAVAVAAYGLLAHSLGFYWDDWGFAWITRTFGNPGLTRYFSTNRPFWGLLYKLTTPLLGQNPLIWQGFAIFWRWLSAVALWWALCQAWPKRSIQAAWVALLFLVYPGFGEQSIAITFGHMFLVLTIFFFSLGLMVLALRRPKHYWLFTILALLGSVVNLFTLEYFFALDLLRPILIWVALGESTSLWRERARKTLRTWLPYLALVVIYTIWRVFIFKFPTYQPEIFGGQNAGQDAVLSSLPATILYDLWLFVARAWSQIWPANFLPPAGFTLLLVLFLVIAVALGLWIYLGFLKADSSVSSTESRPFYRWFGRLDWILIGILALLLGGLPFWMTALPVGLAFPNDRFTLPAMLGASLLLVGLVDLLPRRFLKVALLGAAIALAVGVQFMHSYDHRLDWKDQKTFLWQLTWRAPSVRPGTTFLSEDLPFRYESDNSLTAPVNWLYAPDNKTQQMSFMVYFFSVRLGPYLPGLSPNLPFHQDYLAAGFDGNTSQMLLIQYSPGCLRVLDPVYDAGTPMLTDLEKEALPLSRTDLIQPAPDTGAPFLQRFFGPEPEHGWCYYYEKASLARQEGDWSAVASLGDQAFQLHDTPSVAEERLPFIEGYAHVGRWQDAERLTRDTLKVTPLVKPMLCAAWERIGAGTPASPDQASAVGGMRSELGCQLK
jgi:hypothetical protein